MSTKAMRAPACEIASVVAMKVCGTVTTMSPGATPAAIKAKRSASVPLLTPTQNCASQNSANSRSNSSTIGPPMNPAVAKVFFTTASNSVSSSWCGVTRSRNGTIAVFVTVLFFLLSNETQEFGGISGHNGVCRNIFCDHAPSADNGVLTDGDPAQNRCARADRSTLLDQRFFDLPVSFQFQLPARGGGPGIEVIDKGHRMTDKHVVLNVYALADERMAGNLAAAPDPRILLNLDEGPDFGFVANFTAIEVNEFGELYVFSELDGRGDRNELAHRASASPRLRTDFSAASRIRTTRRPATPSLNGFLFSSMHFKK